ncbi:hypothetical protein B0H12DRAFT_204511 [Mycena haematopus]|nr:hypothetical protein B0H12DRAFT_204511 [Mycena haematopus]
MVEPPAFDRNKMDEALATQREARYQGYEHSADVPLLPLPSLHFYKDSEEVASPRNRICLDSTEAFEEIRTITRRTISHMANSAAVPELVCMLNVLAGVDKTAERALERTLNRREVTDEDVRTYLSDTPPAVVFKHIALDGEVTCGLANEGEEVPGAQANELCIPLELMHVLSEPACPPPTSTSAARSNSSSTSCRYFTKQCTASLGFSSRTSLSRLRCLRSGGGKRDGRSRCGILDGLWRFCVSGGLRGWRGRGCGMCNVCWRVFLVLIGEDGSYRRTPSRNSSIHCAKSSTG